MDEQRQSQLAQGILENEVFQDLCKRMEADAVEKVRKAASTDEMWAARAKLNVIAELHRDIESLARSYEFTQSRQAHKPLA